MDFKLAVELSKLAHVIAYSHDVDEEALHRPCEMRGGSKADQWCD